MLLQEAMRTAAGLDVIAALLRCGADPLAAPQPVAESDEAAGAAPPAGSLAPAADASCALRVAAAAVATSHAAVVAACARAVNRRVAEFRFHDGAAVSCGWKISLPSVDLCRDACLFSVLSAATDAGSGVTRDLGLEQHPPPLAQRSSAPPRTRDAIVVEMMAVCAATPADGGLRRLRPAAASPEVDAALAMLRASSARVDYADDTEMQHPEPRPAAPSALPPSGPLHLLRTLRRVIVDLDRRFDDEAVRDEAAAAFSLRCARGALELRMASTQGLLAAAAAAPQSSLAAHAALRCRLVGCWCIQFAFVFVVHRAIWLAVNLARYRVRTSPVRIASAGWSVAAGALDRPFLAVVLSLLAPAALPTTIIVLMCLDVVPFGWSTWASYFASMGVFILGINAMVTFITKDYWNLAL